MKNKIMIAVSLLALSPIAFAQAAVSKPTTPVTPTVTTTPLKGEPVTPPVTLNEVDSLRLQNFVLNFTLARKAAEEAQKNVTETQKVGEDFIHALEKKYSAVFEPSTGTFTAAPKK